MAANNWHDLTNAIDALNIWEMFGMANDEARGYRIGVRGDRLRVITSISRYGWADDVAAATDVVGHIQHAESIVMTAITQVWQQAQDTDARNAGGRIT